MKSSEFHSAPVYLNGKSKRIFILSSTMNKPVKVIYLCGIIKQNSIVNILVLLHFVLLVLAFTDYTIFLSIKNIQFI